MIRRSTRFAPLAVLLAFAACSESPQDPTAPMASIVAPKSFDVISQVYTSGPNVMTWDAIPETNQPDDFGAAYCGATPAVGLNANWQNPHNAFVVDHPWANDFFVAPWINAWNTRESQNSGNPTAPYYNWSKYSTQVTGNGSFVIRLLADNCSWIYLDGTLVGIQGTDLSKNSYGLTLNGTHTLEFVIFDGGGASGGKFILETTTNPPPPLNVDLDGDGHPNSVDAFPLDPTEWADSDGDGVGDNHDAFPLDPTETVDSDGDGVGDNHDAYPHDSTRWLADTDGDGINDSTDNCPVVTNANQADLDHDGIGDACDPDIDGDGIANSDDAYPTDPSRWLPDLDNDGVTDGADNCPAVSNSNQADLDHDGIGDACDPDIDGDGVSNVNNVDNCPTVANTDQADLDHDGIGDACDPDIDGDGVSNSADNCPVVTNANQADLDHDGIGDACDPDMDGDGHANAVDVFPYNPAEWADSDGDGVGDNADPYDNSNTGPFVIVVGCDTGAPNRNLGGGVYYNDLVAAAYGSAANHGAFVSAVSDLANGWKKAGQITGREQGAIVSCAAHTK